MPSLSDLQVFTPAQEHNSSEWQKLSSMVRESFPDGPIVAVLPGAARGAARGDGNKYVSLGFDDFACTPITRQNILATIGKYLGFEPITTPVN